MYACLAAIVNTKFPNVGELLLRRLVLAFKRGFRRNDKTRCMASTRFIAHLVNHQVGKAISQEFCAIDFKIAMKYIPRVRTLLQVSSNSTSNLVFTRSRTRCCRWRS